MSRDIVPLNDWGGVTRVVFLLQLITLVASLFKTKSQKIYRELEKVCLLKRQFTPVYTYVQANGKLCLLDAGVSCPFKVY